MTLSSRNKRIIAFRTKKYLFAFCYIFLPLFILHCTNTEKPIPNLPGGQEVPNSPSNLQVTPVSSSQIDLSWTGNSDNETGFRIERAPDDEGSPGSYEIIHTTSSDENSFNDTGLAPDTTYHYRVYAFNDAGDSSPAETNATTQGNPSAVPDAPSDLTAITVSSSEIALSWTDYSDNETGFRIERAPDDEGSPGSYEIIHTTSSDENSFNDTGLAPDTTYHYRVYAFNEAGDSSPVEASATTQVVVTSQSITQYGITWTFDKQYETGQFINGDYWVLGPVIIISIDPVSSEIEGRIKNGSMLNPDPGIGNEDGYDKESQGYDSHMWLNDHHYEAELNVAFDVSSEKPLTIEAGSSLVSTISHDEASHRPALKAAAVLTVLNEAPPEGSFRPPYAGTDKSIKHNINTVNSNISKLAKLDHTSLTDPPEPAVVHDWFKRPWLEHIPGHMGEYIHPTDNMPEYGGNVAERISESAAWLHLDFSDEEKMPLLVGFIQCGIDFFGIIQNGYEENGKILQWWAAGGQCGGRKWPILFAGKMLNDEEMIDILSDENIIFQEDGQTFYVDQEAVDYTGYSDDMCGHNGDDFACGGYDTDMIGMPEWGIAHGVTRYRDTPRWETMYRQCCTAQRWGGFVLAAIIMGLSDEWGHNALFDYMDRYIQYEDTYNGGSSRQGSLFVGDMWDQYRDSFSLSWPCTDWSAFNAIVYDMYSE